MPLPQCPPLPRLQPTPARRGRPGWRAGVAALALGSLAGCTFPNKAPPLAASVHSIGLAQNAQGQWQAVPPHCETFRESSRLSNWNTPRDDLAFGCATYTNLAHQLARPADLAAPVPYAGTDARVARDAVQRYLENQVTPLMDNNSTSGLGGN